MQTELEQLKLSTLVLQLVIAGALALAWVVVEWCRSRRSQVELALAEMDEFQRASMAIIKDMSVPLDVVEFVVDAGRHLNNPAMARHVVKRIRSGPHGKSQKTVEFESLDAKALENFSKVVVYATLLSATHDFFRANKLRSEVISALTKPAKSGAVPPAVKTRTTFDPLEPLWPRQRIEAVGAVDVAKVPQVAPALVPC